MEEINLNLKELKEKAQAKKFGAILHSIFFGGLLLFVAIIGLIKFFGDIF